MKKTLVVFAIAFCSTLFAQKAEKSDNASIPTNVKEAFAKKYPTVKKVKWEKEDTTYEGSFVFNKVETSVVMDSKGSILETEKEMAVSKLSSKITAYVAKNYPKQKIKEAAEIVDSKNKKTFEAEVKGLDLLFDENGNFIKASKD